MAPGSTSYTTGCSDALSTGGYLGHSTIYPSHTGQVSTTPQAGHFTLVPETYVPPQGNSNLQVIPTGDPSGGGTHDAPATTVAKHFHYGTAGSYTTYPSSGVWSSACDTESHSHHALGSTVDVLRQGVSAWGSVVADGETPDVWIEGTYTDTHPTSSG